MTSDLNTVGDAVGRPELLKEPHWDETRLGSLSGLCVAEFAASGHLRSIGHFSNDILDFIVRPRGAGLQASVHEEDVITEDEGRAGGQLVLWFEDLNQALAQLNTGELMRMVVATSSGSLYCGRVKLRLHLVGLTRERDGADHLDNTMNRLITRIRSEIYKLADEHLGGDRNLSVNPVEPGVNDGFTFELGLKARAEAVLGARLRGLWPRFVNVDDLHYAALYHDWTLVCVGDTFDHLRMGPQFMDIDPSQRRALYRDIVHLLRSDLARLRDMLRPITRDPIDRLVLDVQEGALYIHWLGRGTGDFILGVTLDQIRVDVAERRLRMLIAELPYPYARQQ
jgi:hypothetical protein